MNAYCLFCHTQKAGQIALLLEKNRMPRAFSPKIIKRQRVQGKNIDMTYDLLPGYIFAYAEEGHELSEYTKGITGIIRRLGKPEEFFRLDGTDYEFAMNLYKKDGVVGQVTVFKEGDTVRLSDSLFNGSSGKVTKLDIKKQRVQITFSFAGMECRTWAACELLEKDGL